MNSQPIIEDPKIEVNAPIWADMDGSERGKIFSILPETIIIKYKNRLSSYPISSITVEFISPYLTLVADPKKEKVLE